MLEIAAAVLPIGIKEESIELLVEVIVVRDIAARAGWRIELRESAPEITREPLYARPAQRLARCVLRQCEMEKVCDRAPLHQERAVHVGFADLEFGIEQHSPLGGPRRVADRQGFAGSVAKLENVTACC